MSISVVRSFVSNRVLEEDSNFKQWGDAFNRDNIPRSIFDRAYFIQYENPSNNDTENCYVDDNVTATLELFLKGYRSPQEALDNAMDKAYRIKLRSSNPTHWTDLIKHVVVESVVPSPVDSNDNSIIITLEYTLRLISTVS